MKTLDDLPADIVFKILCKLPVKEVIRLTSLQKSLSPLLHSKSFIDSYSKETLINGANPPLLFIQFVDPKGLVKYSLRHDNKGLDEFVPVQFPLPGDCRSFPEVGFCNGLVCLLDFKGNELILWNPYIRKILTLPKSNYVADLRNFIALGFVDETSDFKVLNINDKRQAELYSLQFNCWKVIRNSPVDIQFLRKLYPVCVKSSLYWLSLKRDSVQSTVVTVFDLKSEVFGEISLPDGWQSVRSSARLHLKAFKTSSIAVVGSSKDLGIMEPRGSNLCVSHIQVMDVNEKRWNKYSVLGSPWSGRTCVMGFNKEGDEIIERGRFRAIAVHRDGRCRNIIKQRYIEGGFLCNYVNNLALLDKSGETSREVKRRKCVDDVQTI